MYRIVVVIAGVVGIMLSLLFASIAFIPWDIAGVLVAVSVGVPTLVFLGYERIRPEARVKPEQERPQKTKPVEKIEAIKLKARTPLVQEISEVKGHGSFYDFQLRRGEPVRGRITSDNPISIFFMDEPNFEKWGKGKSFDFEQGTEGVYETTVNYRATKGGTWFLVIEKSGRERAKVQVDLYK